MFDNDQDDFMEDDLDSDLSCCLSALLDLDLISVEWSEELEEFMFYMTDEQKEKHDLIQIKLEEEKE
ncbi:MAG TPA: hypothetical protein EYN67_15000 [Flavobacteriales bacterium]|nr:hypothetical protein [Flavobacteriales bacterium]HIB83374.1 hypothetical protein [Chromatiaceae bacterium]